MPVSTIPGAGITTSTTLTTPIVATTMGVGGATPSNSGSGITFPATQSASTDVNTLDDYEEGTWTPRIEGTGGSAGAQAYAAQFGRYVKIGRFVLLTGYLLLSNKGSYTSQVRLTGFPFTVTSENASYSGTSFYALNFNAPATTYGVGIYAIIGATSGDLWVNSAGGVTVLTDYASQVTNNVQVGPLQICYYTNG